MENTFDQKIIFPDGYAVTLIPDRLTVKSGGCRATCDPLFLGEVGAESPMFERIRKAGCQPSDYLTDHIIFVRAGDGVRQAVQDVQERKREEVATKKRRREQRRVEFFNQEISL